ncbi:MAG: hypothetical protein Q4E89_09280 [Eubacteriales bacterium]|nr:hypothetical protein [Eubacteriales bacterium]
MADGYSKIPKAAEFYTTTEEYQTYARPYSVIFSFVRIASSMTVSDTMEWTPDENELYAKRLSVIENTWQNAVLSSERRYTSISRFPADK